MSGIVRLRHPRDAFPPSLMPDVQEWTLSTSTSGSVQPLISQLSRYRKGCRAEPWSREGGAWRVRHDSFRQRIANRDRSDGCSREVARARQRRLSELTTQAVRSTAFNAYRGTAWMKEPCRSCNSKETDWDGCRYVCVKTSDHGLMSSIGNAVDVLLPAPEFIYRRLSPMPPVSKCG